jgi:hypothetical protein
MAIVLDSSFANHAFNSWRINVRNPIVCGSETLPSPLLFQNIYGVDFIRTYTAVLHNNLHRLDSKSICAFLKSKDGIRLYQLSPLEDLGDFLYIQINSTWTTGINHTIVRRVKE